MMYPIAGRSSYLVAAFSSLLLTATLAAILITATGCRQDRGDERPSIIVLSLDTLRQDAVGPWRAGADSLTPRLDGLAEESVVFLQAFSPMPFTLPAHMTMMTGLFPDTHRVDRNTRRLSEKVPVVAEELQRAGYSTHAVVASAWLKDAFGFGRGFDDYALLGPGLTYARRVRDQALQLLDTRADKDRPFFLFAHLFDAHSDTHSIDNNTLPYYSPQRGGEADDGQSFCDSEGRCATELLLAADRSESTLTQAVADEITALYEDGVRYLDAEVGRFLDDLSQRDLLDDTLLIIVSDHGEELRDHGLFIHAQPYDECLAVPFLVKFPGGRHAGLRVDHLVELADIAPTALTEAGVKIPSGMGGQALQEILAETEPPRPWVLGQDKLRRQRYALRTPTWKLIHDLASGDSELYNVELDPREKTNIIGEHPERAAALLEDLTNAVNQAREIGYQNVVQTDTYGTKLTDDERAQLEALGYVLRSPNE